MVSISIYKFYSFERKTGFDVGSLLLMPARFLAKRYIPQQKMSERVNRKCPPRNTIVPTFNPLHRLRIPYHRQTDRQTDDTIMPIADCTASIG